MEVIGFKHAIKIGKFGKLLFDSFNDTMEKELQLKLRRLYYDGFDASTLDPLNSNLNQDKTKIK